jgi:hypothetical protein
MPEAIESTYVFVARTPVSSGKVKVLLEVNVVGVNVAL